eukprot:scaffold125362_cov56-Attheya_sp.AAC.1
MFAQTNGIECKSCSIKYLVEEAWGMGHTYVLFLLTQLSNDVANSEVDNEIMDTVTVRFFAAQEVPKDPGDVVIARHKHAIRRKKARGWRREEVKKICSANGEKVGKQLCIGEKNQLLKEYYLLKQRAALIKQRRNKGGMFAPTKGIECKSCSIKYLVEEAWGMGHTYVLFLLKSKQLRNGVVNSEVDNEIMDNKGLARKDGIHMPAPLPAATEASL